MAGAQADILDHEVGVRCCGWQSHSEKELGLWNGLELWNGRTMLK